MDKIVRELVEEAWEWARIGRDRDPMDKSRVFSETLADLESSGDAMRYLIPKVRLRGRRHQTCAITSMT
jgi:hypothetical protein